LNGRSGFNISGVSRGGRLAIAGLAVLAVGACGPFCNGKVAVANAHVDPTFSCPRPADNYAYKVHGSVDIDNPTNQTLTVKSITEENTTVAIHGNWTGPLGAKGGSTITDFTPKTVKSGSKAIVRFTIAFECTDSGPSVSTYADFDFKFTVVTSAGTFKLDGANKHRLVTP
jgi:hypothetical protein